MRIDYVITGLDIGGAEAQVVDLLENLARKGHDVRVFSLTKPKFYVERLNDLGISLYSLNMTSALQLPFALWKLCRILRSSPPEILHGHMVHANIMVRLARIFFPKIKIISTAHNTTEGGKVRDWLYRLTNHLSDINTTVSNAATERFIKEKVFSKRNTITVFNGIDTHKYQPRNMQKLTSGPFHWIAVGRLVEQKDYPNLLSAFSLLKYSRLSIVGDGCELEKLRKLATELGLDDRVEFLGLRHDVNNLYNAVDGFVLSSEWEGYGLVVAEAMASCLPVVVTDSGGPSDIVGRDSKSGLIVDIKNPHALSEALSKIEKLTTSERNELVSSARARIIDNFDIHEISLIWENIYTKLINKKSIKGEKKDLE